MEPAKYFTVIAVLLFSCSNGDGITSPCSLEPDSGHCEAAIPKYYFDKEERECKEFIWGGCQGVVPFDTMQECLECENGN